MATTDVSLVNQSPQNPFIQGIADLAGAIGGIAQQGANVYSTFLSAKTTAKLAAQQQAGYNIQPTQTGAWQVPVNQQSFLIYAGVGVAVLGTLALIYKAVK